MKRITIKDVAQQAGVSTTTVSRILNDKRVGVPISSGTRGRVLQVARELGYAPNFFARGLKTRRSRTLGVLVEGELASSVARGVDVLNWHAQAKGYRALVAARSGGASDAGTASGMLESSAAFVDGVLLLGTTTCEFMDAFFSVDPRHVVSVLGGMPAGRMASFNVDNFTGVRYLVDHLVELGHRDIAFLGDTGSWNATERLAALRSLQEEGRLSRQAGYLQVVADGPRNAADVVHKLVSLNPPPTAILCSNDRLALGAVQRLLELGVRIPSEVSVVGFDDEFSSLYTFPSLTTVRLPMEELAARSVALLISMIAGDFDPWLLTNTLVRPELVVRQSSGPARR